MKNKPMVKPLQALFVTKDGVLFLQEGLFLDNPKQDWPETIDANVHSTSPIVGAPAKQIVMTFEHGVVELPIARIHAYLEKCEATGVVATLPQCFGKCDNAPQCKQCDSHTLCYVSRKKKQIKEGVPHA